MKRFAVIAAVAAAVVVLAIGGYYLRMRSAASKWAGPMKEIVEEEVDHDGNVTKAHFVSLIDGPVDAVQRAVWAVEDSQKTIENIKLSKLLSTKDNTKVVEMNIAALNLPVQSLVMEFTLVPDQHRIAFKTLKSQVQEIEGSYQFEASPDGKRTRLDYTSTARDKITLPFPQAVLDSANRETYVNTVRSVQKQVSGASGG